MFRGSYLFQIYQKRSFIKRWCKINYLPVSTQDFATCWPANALIKGGRLPSTNRTRSNRQAYNLQYLYDVLKYSINSFAKKGVTLPNRYKGEFKLRGPIIYCVRFANVRLFYLKSQKVCIGFVKKLKN